MAPSKSTERETREARERLRRYNARKTVHSQQLTRRKRDNIVAIGGVLVVAALAAVSQVFYFNGGPGTPTPAPSISAATPETPAGENVGDVPDASLAEARIWTGSITLNEIPLAFTLDGALAPQAVSSVIADIQSQYYQGKNCHRLLVSESAGLIQCGSLDGVGGSDPAYSFGPVETAGVEGVYRAGTIAMARAGDNAYSFGHQFFIVFADSTLPDDSVGGYSIVGQVTSGLDQFVAQIASGGIVGGTQDGAPVIPTIITSFTIE